MVGFLIALVRIFPSYLCFLLLTLLVGSCFDSDFYDSDCCIFFVFRAYTVILLLLQYVLLRPVYALPFFAVSPALPGGASEQGDDYIRPLVRVVGYCWTNFRWRSLEVLLSVDDIPGMRLKHRQIFRSHCFLIGRLVDWLHLIG